LKIPVSQAPYSPCLDFDNKDPTHTEGEHLMYRNVLGEKVSKGRF